MCNCEYNKEYKIDEYLNAKSCSCKNRLFGKLILACEDEILNTTETILVDKKVTCEINYCLIQTVPLGVTCL